MKKAKENKYRKVHNTHKNRATSSLTQWKFSIGMQNSHTRPVLKCLCSSNKPHFLFVVKPWTSLDKILVSFWDQLHLFP